MSTMFAMEVKSRNLAWRDSLTRFDSDFVFGAVSVQAFSRIMRRGKQPWNADCGVAVEVRVLMQCPWACKEVKASFVLCVMVHYDTCGFASSVGTQY